MAAISKTNIKRCFVNSIHIWANFVEFPLSASTMPITHTIINHSKYYSSSVFNFFCQSKHFVVFYFFFWLFLHFLSTFSSFSYLIIVTHFYGWLIKKINRADSFIEKDIELHDNFFLLVPKVQGIFATKLTFIKFCNIL